MNVWTAVVAFLTGVIWLVAAYKLVRLLLYNYELKKSFHFGFHLLIFVWATLRLAFFIETTILAPEHNSVLALVLNWLPHDCLYAILSLLVTFYTFLCTHNDEWVRVRGTVFVGVFYAATAFRLTVTLAYITLASQHDAGTPIDPELKHTHYLVEVGMYTLLFCVHGVYAYKHVALGDTGGRRLLVLPRGWMEVATSCIVASRGVFLYLTAEGYLAMKDFGTFRRIDASGFTLLLLWELTPCFLILLKFHNIPKLARRDTPIVRYFFKFVRLFSRTRQRKIYQTNSSDSPIGSSLDDSWRGSNYYGAMDSSLDSEPGSFEQVEGEAGELIIFSVDKDGLMRVSTGFSSRAKDPSLQDDESTSMLNKGVLLLDSPMTRDRRIKSMAHNTPGGSPTCHESPYSSPRRNPTCHDSPYSSPRRSMGQRNST